MRKLHPILEPGVFATEQGRWTVTPEVIAEVLANSKVPCPFGPHHWPKGMEPAVDPGRVTALILDGSTLLAEVEADGSFRDAINDGVYPKVSGEFRRIPGEGWTLERLAALDYRVPPAYDRQGTLTLATAEVQDSAVTEYDMALGTAINLAVEVRENYIYVNVRPKGEFDAFRWGALSDEEGIYAIYGRRKDDPSTWEIQALRFDKDKGWTAERAARWKAERTLAYGEDVARAAAMATPLDATYHTAKGELDSMTDKIKQSPPTNDGDIEELRAALAAERKRADDAERALADASRDAEVDAAKRLAREVEELRVANAETRRTLALARAEALVANKIPTEVASLAAELYVRLAGSADVVRCSVGDGEDAKEVGLAAAFERIITSLPDLVRLGVDGSVAVQTPDVDGLTAIERQMCAEHRVDPEAYRLAKAGDDAALRAYYEKKKQNAAAGGTYAASA